ncbi:radical SAM protein [Lacrimispora sp. AGF001]|uniref:radical SAM protein n=1 Tax=Lacrimispora sp. AGF001 TaxID=3401631 RepID=UPI003B42D65D
MEMFDVYSSNGIRTGKIEDRKYELLDGEFRLGVNAYICNSQKQFLIQKRSAQKEILSGVWDIHMGHATTGEESDDTLFREIKEELGITLVPSNIRLKKRFVWYEEKYLLDLYFIVSDIKISECVLQKSEVDDVKYIDLDEMKYLIDRMNRPLEYKRLVYKGVEDLLAALNKTENIELPVIAEWKIKLLEFGVNTESDFRTLSNADSYKMKLRTMNPVANNFKVVDTAADQELIPSEILLSDDNKGKSIVKLRYNPNSPLVLAITNSSDGTMQIIDKLNGCICPLKVSLVPAPKKLITQVQIGERFIDINVFDYISLLGMDRISIIPYDGCWNWNLGTPCKFCDLHPKREIGMTSLRPTLNDLHKCNFDAGVWWNQYAIQYYKCLSASLKCFFENVKIEPHLHLMIMAGNLPDSNLLWKICENIVDIVSEYVNLEDIDSYLNIAPHNNIEDLARLKRKGLKQVQYNLEVSNEETFRDTCPGKMDFSKIKNKLIEAVTVMGKGNVRSNFVFGLQPMNELLDDINILSSKGVVCDYSVFQPKRGTPYAQRKAPDMKDIVTFSKELAAIYKHYNFKPIFCSLSSRSSIINELMEQD